MNKNDYKWKVAPAPTGRYRSFDCRLWPSAETKDSDDVVAYISCDDEYHPSNVRTGTHAPLTLHIRFGHPVEDRDKLGWFSWKHMKVTCATLAEAKEAFATFVMKHPDHNWGLH